MLDHLDLRHVGPGVWMPEASSMPVKVKFPDGQEREVASCLRSMPNPSGASLVEVPLESPDWRFIPIAGGWLAMPKKHN